MTLHALDDARAAHARALGERLREIGRIGLAVAGNPHRAGEVVGAQDRRDARRLRPGEMNSNSMPKLFARAICRFISVSRSGVFATLRLPHCFQPVASPVSASSDE